MSQIKTKTYTFQEADPIGSQTLDVISNADKFNAWTYATILPFCKGRILEVGSGVGNISQFFLKDQRPIFLSDIRKGYCETLKETLGHSPSLEGVSCMDLVDPNFETRFQHLLGTFDTVFALNVIEHIEDDQLAIANCYKLLRSGGHLIILVPAYQWLYNGLDEALAHYKRYNKKSLRALFQTQALEVLHQQYFNFAGIFAWLISGKLSN